MDNICISQEERQRIVDEMRSYIGVKNSFECDKLARILNTDYWDDDQCWNKLIELIESAPAKKNMRAGELADKLEECFNKNFSANWIGDALGYNGNSTTYSEDIRCLINAIRSLDMPDEDARWPLDKDGMEIKPGDTVYLGKNEHVVAYVAYGLIGARVRLAGVDKPMLHSPGDLTHNRPRTILDIIREIHASNDNNIKTDLVREAYELGRADGNEQ